MATYYFHVDSAYSEYLPIAVTVTYDSVTNETIYITEENNPATIEAYDFYGINDVSVTAQSNIPDGYAANCSYTNESDGYHIVVNLEKIITGSDYSLVVSGFPSYPVNVTVTDSNGVSYSLTFSNDGDRQYYYGSSMPVNVSIDGYDSSEYFVDGEVITYNSYEPMYRVTVDSPVYPVTISFIASPTVDSVTLNSSDDVGYVYRPSNTLYDIYGIADVVVESSYTGAISYTETQDSTTTPTTWHIVVSGIEPVPTYSYNLEFYVNWEGDGGYEDNRPSSVEVYIPYDGNSVSVSSDNSWYASYGCNEYAGYVEWPEVDGYTLSTSADGYKHTATYTYNSGGDSGGESGGDTTPDEKYVRVNAVFPDGYDTSDITEIVITLEDRSGFTNISDVSLNASNNWTHTYLASEFDGDLYPSAFEFVSGTAVDGLEYTQNYVDDDYGRTFTVTYTENSGSSYIYTNDSWQKAQAYVYTGGEWTSTTVHRSSGSLWSR